MTDMQKTAADMLTSGVNHAQLIAQTLIDQGQSAQELVTACTIVIAAALHKLPNQAAVSDAINELRLTCLNISQEMAGRNDEDSEVQNGDDIEALLALLLAGSDDKDDSNLG